MVGIGFALVALGAWLVVSWYRHRDLPRSPWFLRAAALSGVGAVLAMEAGWVVTEISDELWLQRPFGAAFAASSLLTPVEAAAGDPAVLTACRWALGIGALLLVPSLLYLSATSALVIVGWPG